MSTLVVGQSAPDFTLPDLNGRPHTLSDALKRGPVVLVFWKTSCGTSRTTFPYLVRLRQTYSQDSWQLWGIGQDPRDDIENFLRRTGPVTFPLLIDYPDYAVSKLYDPVATPTTFEVRADDTIGGAVLGFSKEALNALSGRVAARVGAAPVEIAPPGDGNPSLKPG